jgi:hypothetical protein
VNGIRRSDDGNGADPAEVEPDMAGADWPDLYADDGWEGERCRALRTAIARARSVPDDTRPEAAASAT